MTSKTKLHRNGKSRHLCLVPDLSGKAFSLSALSVMFSVCLSIFSSLLRLPLWPNTWTILETIPFPWQECILWCCVAECGVCLLHLTGRKCCSGLLFPYWSSVQLFCPLLKVKCWNLQLYVDSCYIKSILYENNIPAKLSFDFCLHRIHFPSFFTFNYFLSL
jgi:hypothetical protein